MELISRKSLPPRLIERLTTDLVEKLGCAEPIRARRVWMRRHRYSCVFRIDYTTVEGELAIYLKCGDSSEPPLKQIRWAERFRAEFDILRRLWPEFQDRGEIGVVRPLSFYPEFDTLATVAAPGIRLRRFLRLEVARLRKRSHAFSAALKYVTQSGSWLRQFQQLTATAPQPFDVDELQEYCEDRLVTLRQNHRIDIDARLASLLMDRLSATVGVAPTPMAGCHGDFMGHNIMVYEGRMRVLDFTMYEENSTVYDPCSFWSELEFLKHDIRARDELFSRLQDAFLEAYGKVDADDPLFKAVHIRYLLVALCRAVESTSSSLWTLVTNRRRARTYYDRLRKFALSGQ